MEIIEATARNGGRPVRTRDLCERFGIKQNLLAHDINALAALNLVERGHGWVAARIADKQAPFHGTEFSTRQSRDHEAKRAIACYIAGQLCQASDVILDAGSTALAIAEQLARDEHPLDVYTNNVAALLRLGGAPAVTCRLIGGDYNPQQAATAGADAAAAIEGRTFSAGVITPRSLMLIPPGIALADQLPSGAAARAALSQVAKAQAMEATEAGKRSLFLSIYSAENAQRELKAVMIKNSIRLFIAADHSKLFAAGEPFFTIIIPPAAAPSRRTEDVQHGTTIRRARLAPVRSRGPVRVRRIANQETSGSDAGMSRSWSDIDVDASVDVRDVASTVLVTSTDENDEVPAELLRQLMAVTPEEGSEALLKLARSAIVVVNRSGEAVPLELS